jgi:hypothetical protein
MFVHRKDRERGRARELRARGWALRRIAVDLGVALSSVSVWVRDIDAPRATTGGESTAPNVRADPDPEPSAAATRRCGRCGRCRPEGDFNRHPRGRQGWCRECFAEYFRQRRSKHRAQVRAAKMRRRDDARRLLLRCLASTPCTDCGERDPVVLEFDHVGEKRRNVSALVAEGSSLSAIEAELAMCEVVCVNCHRKRTALRGAWRRARPDWRKALTGLTPQEARNVSIAYSALERSGCVDCGIRDLRVLDFDHVAPGKTANVLDLARRAVRAARLTAEIGRFEVRCANCHRRRTLAVQGSYRVTPPKL